LSADFPRDSLAAAGLDESSKFQVPNSREAPNFNIQRKKNRLFFLSNLRIEISLELGPWDLELCRRRVAWKSVRYWERGQKEFVIAAAATIFRALCRSLSLAAKLENQSRNDSK
jgi:hypothetical protein